MLKNNKIQESMNEVKILQQKALQLLKLLIAIPSFSKEESATADCIQAFFDQEQVQWSRVKNNLWSKNLHFDPSKRTILLNSHHDTVRPNKGFTLDPFEPFEQDGKLFGLGSNDAGGCLVSLMATYLYYYRKEGLLYNIVFVASAEEEISGTEGIELALKAIPAIDFGIVGEPTLMEMAIAERGLMVLDVESIGKAGHAAREEGESALYKILPDLNWFKTYAFEKVSPLLGAVKMSVTVIETDNKQHNVVPSNCKMIVDVRVNELYTFEEVIETIKKNISASMTPRSLRLRSTSIAVDHILIKAGLALGKGYYGSVTTSDKALMPFPTLKMGPGDSARSHSADEFIFTQEIESGIITYIQLLENVLSYE